MIKEYNIADGVKAFSTTRKGGVSTGNYGEFNINEYCGDEAVNIAANRKQLADELGISTDHIFMPHQVHGVEVRQIAGEFLSMPENIRKMVLEGVDAVITSEKVFASAFLQPIASQCFSMMRNIRLWLLSMQVGEVR